MSFFSNRILHPNDLWLSWLEGSKVTVYQCLPQMTRYSPNVLHVATGMQKYTKICLAALQFQLSSW